MHHAAMISMSWQLALRTALGQLAGLSPSNVPQDFPEHLEYSSSQVKMTGITSQDV